MVNNAWVSQKPRIRRAGRGYMLSPEYHPPADSNQQFQGEGSGSFATVVDEDFEDFGVLPLDMLLRDGMIGAGDLNCGDVEVVPRKMGRRYKPGETAPDPFIQTDYYRDVVAPRNAALKKKQL